MPNEIRMPQLSDSMTEGTVICWYKRVGATVRPQEVIMEVETDKATMPMEAFEAGTLAVILVGDGQTAKVGQVLGVLAAPGEDPLIVKYQYTAPAPPTAPKSVITRRRRLLGRLRKPPP